MLASKTLFFTLFCTLTFFFAVVSVADANASPDVHAAHRRLLKKRSPALSWACFKA